MIYDKTVPKSGKRVFEPTSRMSLKAYCPQTPYGYDFYEIIQEIVSKEAEMIIPDRPVKLPEYQETKEVKPSVGLWNLIKQFAP